MRPGAVHGEELALVYLDELDSRLGPIHRHAVISVLGRRALRRTSRARDHEPRSTGNIHGLSSMNVAGEDYVDRVRAE